VTGAGLAQTRSFAGIYGAEAVITTSAVIEHLLILAAPSYKIYLCKEARSSGPRATGARP
jgi:hypothetical protein